MCAQTDPIQPERLLTELASQIVELGINDQDRLNRAKLDFCRKHELSWMPRNSDILSVLPPELRERFSEHLRIKKVRSVSGINVIGVMSSPRGCPHGRCVFCPMEKGFPMSYTSGEPAAMRGLQFGYDPFLQITSRIEQLRAIGHEPSKVELVIQGGTFLAAPYGYQEEFVKRCLDAISDVESRNLEEAKVRAETSRIRNVGLTIETKPDWCKESHVNKMLRFGCTRVEIGVQIIDDAVYELTNRGHSVQDVVESFQIARDAGFKIVAHMMPGLPGSNFQKDLASFKALFTDPRFRPDMMKIYPCLVMEGTELFEWWKRGDYEAFTTEDAVELIAQVKEFVPPWVRIMRVHREFPVHLIKAGVKNGNLRELALERLSERGKRCRCIRCREIGHRTLKDNVAVDAESVQMIYREYEVSGGKEFFISMEDPDSDTLVGYIRLRMPSEKSTRREVDCSSALVRELHVYGPEVPVGRHHPGSWQHIGFGRKLLAEAETKARQAGANRVLVLSALGTKEYYRREGYHSRGAYMCRAMK
jgi:elongator complex protein 3